MSKKIIFFFPPTGMPGIQYENEEAEKNFSDDVIRIYLEHCGNGNIGNGTVFPDFSIVARKIGAAFNNNRLNLEALRQNLGTGIAQIKGNIDAAESTIEVDRICLQGYSRGAIAAFAVAKELDRLNVPLDVLADRPVPGQINTWQPFSSYAQYSNLSQCKNIETCTTLLAAHHLENAWWHNIFFKQMIPRYSATTRTNHLLLPYSFHFTPGFREAPITAHLFNQLNTLGYFNPLAADSSWNDVLKNQYTNTDQTYYTPQKYLQEVFGASGSIAKDPFYLEVLQEKARALLDKNKIPCNVFLSNEQASALCVIDKLQFLNDTETTLVKYILSETPNSLKFIQVINEVHEACVYLSHTNFTQNNNKAALIEQHSHNYKKQIFTLTYDYLEKENKTRPDKAKFRSEIKKAQNTFEINALAIDRGSIRQILCFVTNGILFITGACLVANTLNKIITGDWLFFSKTRSTQVMRETIDTAIVPCINASI